MCIIIVPYTNLQIKFSPSLENGNQEYQLTSPFSKDSNRIYINGGGNSSGFSSAGDGSTCSNGTTHPPLRSMN